LSRIVEHRERRKQQPPGLPSKTNVLVRRGGRERESLVASFARGFGTEGEQEEHLLLLESGAGGKVPAHGIATSSPKWIGSTGVIAHPPKSQKKCRALLRSDGGRTLPRETPDRSHLQFVSTPPELVRDDLYKLNLECSRVYLRFFFRTMISESGSVEAMLRSPSGFSPFASSMEHQKVSCHYFTILARLLFISKTLFTLLQNELPQCGGRPY